MSKWQRNIYQFMYGRYGIDDLYKFNLILYFILIIIDIFVNSKILSIIELMIATNIFYRVLSKNKYQRTRENELYLKIKNKVLKPFINIKRNIQDKDYVYKKCHHCKTILRLPLPPTKGIRHSVCPTCKKRNTFLILKSYKIEVIIANKK